MEGAVELSEVVIVLESSLSQTNWRLKASSKRRLQTDILALCTGMRPVIMVDYGGKLPELRERLCAFLKFCQKESLHFKHLRVMVVEDMIYLINIRGLAELIRFTMSKEMGLYFVDLEQDPPKMISELENSSLGKQLISLLKFLSSVFPTNVMENGVLKCCSNGINNAESSVGQLLVNPQTSQFIDLSCCIQDTMITLPTINGWLLGYPVVYLFGKEHIQNAMYNLSSKSLHLFKVFVRRIGTPNKASSEEELMSFSVPHDLSMEGKDEHWAKSFLSRLQARLSGCKQVWVSLRMEVIGCYPQAIVL